MKHIMHTLHIRHVPIVERLVNGTGHPTRPRSSFGCSPLYFRLQALRICDASQASPRVSERSPSGPTGLETNVSASVAPPKKTRVLKHNPTKTTAAITSTPTARPGEHCAASPPPVLSGDKVCPFVLVFASALGSRCLDNGQDRVNRPCRRPSGSSCPSTSRALAATRTSARPGPSRTRCRPA